MRILLVSGVLSLALTVCGCRALTSEVLDSGTQRPTVRAVQVHAGSLPEVLTFKGVLRATRRAAVNSAAAGVVERVAVQDGDRVSAGQPVVWLASAELQARVREQEAAVHVARTRVGELQAQLDLTSSKVSGSVKQAQASYSQAQIEVASARTQLEAARKNLERMQSLFNEKAVPRYQVDQAQLKHRLQQDSLQTSLSKRQAAYEALQTARAGGSETAAQRSQLAGAQASLEQAEASRQTSRVQLEQSVLRAPIDGVVVNRSVDPGQSVGGPGNPLLTVVDNRTLECVSTVDQRFAADLRPGMRAFIRTPLQPDRQAQATVAEVIPSSDPKTSTVRVRMLVSNPKSELVDGFTVNGRITLAEHRGILVRRDAMRREARRTFVYVVDLQSRLEKREVTAEASDETYFVVSKGLAPRDVVVVEAADIPVGTAVDIQMQPSPGP